ncbi:MAG: hypothetical protein AMXMBFR53_42780 [Gemmatimonadota bacterium]
MSAPTGGMETLFALPEGAMVPAGWVRGLIEEAARRRTSEAANREETIQMWVEIATRNLTGAPEATVERS